VINKRMQLHIQGLMSRVLVTCGQQHIHD